MLGGFFCFWDVLRQILRMAKRTRKTHWTHFNECFVFDGTWTTVCGPIRAFLENGGRLDQTEEVRHVLDGASDDQIESLLSSAAQMGLKKKADFQCSEGNLSQRSKPFTLCFSTHPTTCVWPFQDP